MCGTSYTCAIRGYEIAAIAWEVGLELVQVLDHSGEGFFRWVENGTAGDERQPRAPDGCSCELLHGGEQMAALGECERRPGSAAQRR